VVVEDHELFPEQYPNTIVVPLTRDEGLAHKTFAEKIEPAPEDGADTACWALAHPRHQRVAWPCHGDPFPGDPFPGDPFPGDR